MEEKEYIHLCHSLAKTTSVGVRLFCGEECIYYYSVYHLVPDPVTPYLQKLLTIQHRAGVITTPLYQFYGFITLENNYRIVIGPTKMENNDERTLEEQLFILGVTSEQKEEYQRILRCVPMITAERMGWTLAFLATAIMRQPFLIENLYVDTPPVEHRHSVQEKQILQSAEYCDDNDAQEHIQRSYEFEKLLISYIENGEPEKLGELFDALPNMASGQMATDTIRQIKNTGICAATLASRAAIAGGMDSQAAFRLSDLYIQKIELLFHAPSLEKLRSDLMIDYAYQVQKLRYHTEVSENGGKSLFLACADYVSKNIYNLIRVEALAVALGYTRPYLCNQFKKQTGLTLTRYISQEKVLESQRMLEFTDKSLSEIANLFSFSSQSHFQATFKQVSGETPMAYRQRKNKQRRISK